MTDITVSGGLHIQRFVAPCESVDDLTAEYTLIRSIEPRDVRALGGLRFEAQAGLFSFAGGRQSLRESHCWDHEAFSQLAPDQFQHTHFYFVPAALADAAAQALADAVRHWGELDSEEPFGRFCSGGLVIGAQRVPAGLLVLIADQSRGELDEWQESFFGADFPVQELMGGDFPQSYGDKAVHACFVESTPLAQGLAFWGEFSRAASSLADFFGFCRAQMEAAEVMAGLAEDCCVQQPAPRRVRAL